MQNNTGYSDHDFKGRRHVYRARWKRYGFEYLLYVFVVLLLVTLGADYTGHFTLRIMYAYGLLLIFFTAFAKYFFYSDIWRKPEVITFAAFVLYELVRAFWGLVLKYAAGQDGKSDLYIQAPVLWMAYLGIYMAVYAWFRDRDSITRFTRVLMIGTFILAVVAIPALLKNGSGQLGYAGQDGQMGFFPPSFYFAEWIHQYLISRFTHVNWVGDVFSLGFFPALGLTYYSYENFKDKGHLWKRGAAIDEAGYKKLISLVILNFFAAATIAAGIFLLIARGTTLCFSLALVIFLLMPFAKFRSKRQAKFSVFSFLILFVFLYWAGNLNRAWKEVQTVPNEVTISKESSLASNQEAVLRGLRIFRAHPLLGVGTGGYSFVSETYASPNSERYLLARFQAMCHYVQLLAEEGLGAFLYFLFLITYLIAVVRGLKRTESRFKFLMGLAFTCSAAEVLMHAWIHYPMQLFPVSMLVYIAMACSLAILQKDFE